MRLLRIVFVVAFLAIGGKAIALTSTDGHLAAIARDQQIRAVVLPAHRGAILDRDGVQLAVAVPAKTVYATPYMLDDPRTAARELAAALKLKWGRVYRAIDDPKSGFAYVDRQADPTLADRAIALGLPGVADYVEEKRVYPMNTVAAQVVGYAGTTTVAWPVKSTATTSSWPARRVARWSFRTLPARRCASSSRCRRRRGRTFA